ncbi:unnamed protein product [Owenia fusiformis]|uniref:Uncharacterized protein n=1 Tax=Owenia fusiformis TaxID=6347 RepID=A0A8J1TF59_OWEFU|nr:unnamed protein product [Owenia fusiformis]
MSKINIKGLKALKVAQNKASSSKKKEDTSYDLEQQFILRLPPGPAIALRREIQSGSPYLKDKLSIELTPDLRHGNVRYGGQVLNAKVMDLPSILESLKTTDRKTFYKTADVSQMLICSDQMFIEPDPAEMKKKEKEKKYQWGHGITPPLKNVRSRRFRKTLKKKYVDQPDVEKEVKRLFRTDNEAIDVKWEVVADDDKPVEEEQDGMIMKGETSKRNIMMDTGSKPSEMSLLALAEHDIFGDVSSSDEDNDDMDKDINVMDDDDEAMTPRGGTPRALSAVPSDTMDSYDLESSVNMTQQMSMDMGDYSNMEGGDVNIELQAKLEELSNQLVEIKERRQGQESQLAIIDNPALRARFQDELNDLIQQENEKQKEYEILASMLKG